MSESKKEFSGNYVSVNGPKMYYEIHGGGQPLELLHGAFSGIGTSVDVVFVQENYLSLRYDLNVNNYQ